MMTHMNLFLSRLEGGVGYKSRHTAAITERTEKDHSAVNWKINRAVIYSCVTWWSFVTTIYIVEPDPPQLQYAQISVSFHSKNDVVMYFTSN